MEDLFHGMMTQISVCCVLSMKSLGLHVKMNWIPVDFIFRITGIQRGIAGDMANCGCKDTVFTREFQEHMPYEQGVFIDIFPMDGIPDNYLHRCIHNFHCFCIRKILWSEVGKKADKRWWMRIWLGLMSNIPENIIFSHYEKFIKKSNQKKTKLVRMLMFPSPTKDFGYYRKWYQRLEPVLFEGYKLSGMKDRDEYLSWTYGDYMQLPPQDKRKVHPVSEIKLVDLDAE